ncbi:MurR/RpiR family transcriptional regulator [Aminithiophilus ramosus]|uniref:MurR/RpiR family transcriptional regulator n=2 Tax=Synergistales TaxID=649776 RepID=A0A9Q7EY43_9BACT|nr:MurR/RpiR family transcriptional regulator [Aminithiophilus ramosus]QTX33100.1 MurR/RpiR family transcriptional regulator [Aminithiophilus ramosus]QVL37138.1 MurR/RpiR family transcriptional regulator [Synergistota bacterium]
MSAGNVIELIREAYSSLSRQQQRVAQAILDRGNRIAFQTAKELSSHIGVSSATIVRFACRIGFDGYPALARELQRFFYEDNAPMQKLKASFEGPLEKKDLLGHVCEMDRENLLLLRQSAMDDVLERVVRKMGEARRVVLTGGRTSFSLVHYGGFLLRQLDRKFSFFNASVDDAQERLEDLDGECLLLAVSFHRYYRQTRDLVKTAREAGVFVTALTDDLKSPLVPLADALLLAPNRAPFYSYVPAMALLNALVAGYARDLNLSSREVFEKRSRMLLEKDVYV